VLTFNITADFTAAARVGDWVQVHVDIQRVGERLAFANAYLTVERNRIARAALVEKKPADEAGGSLVRLSETQNCCLVEWSPHDLKGER
jgi:acyl-CoA thioesterase FadM